MASQRFDLVLCDIGLPDGSGYDVISKAKAKGPIKAVAITGFGTDEDIRRSKEAGFDFPSSSRWTSKSYEPSLNKWELKLADTIKR
jgi:CheY-like chemotaxis protein